MRRQRVVTSLVLVVALSLGLAACAAPQPTPLPPPPTAEPATAEPPTPEPTPTLEPTIAPTSVPTLAPTSAPTSAPTATPVATPTMQAGPSRPLSLTGELTGTVAYLVQSALPDKAVVEVLLQDTSRADAPATIIASQAIDTNGRQVPISFTLEYDPAVIDANARYTLAARITADNRLLFANTTAYPVLTGDAPVTAVAIQVEPVSVAAAASAAPTATLTTSNTAQLTGTVSYRDRSALPPDAFIVVQLQNVSKADAPADVVAAAQLATDGRQVPVTFTLRYDPTLIDQSSTYALQARIFSADGVAQYASSQRYAVLTDGAPATGVDVSVEAVRGTAPAADLVTITGTVSQPSGVALPANAIVDVQLLDLSTADTPTLMARQLITTPTGQVPFTLYYDPFAIDPAASYAVSATISVSNEVKWLSAQTYPVLTAGALTGVDIATGELGAAAPAPIVSAPPVGPAATPAPLPAQRELTGTVRYQEALSLPAGAVINVQLLDVTSIEAPAITIGQQTIQTTDEQVPVPFAIAYEPSQIDPNHYYLLLATISINGELKWLNNQPVWALTYGNPTGGIDVIVRPVP